MMSLFSRKETIVLKNERHKGACIERLENARIEYSIFEEREFIYSRNVSYIIRVKASDLKRIA